MGSSMKYVVAAVLALVLVFLGSRYVGEYMDQKEQAQAVESFYKTVLELNMYGMPSKGEIDKFKPFISSKLLDGLLQAFAAEEKHTLETKGEEAPLFEGPMFLGVWEGANRMLAAKREVLAGQTTYLVTFEIKSPYNKDPNGNWKDRAILVQENGKWVVDDLVFRVADGSMDGRSLSQSLKP
jgi:hypothetical protein